MLKLTVFLHGRIAIALLVFSFILGVWGFYQFLRHRAVSGGYRSSFLMLAILTGIEDLAGLAVLAAGGRPHDWLHLVYGVFGIIFLPFIYVYTSRGGRDREAAFMSAASWIVLIAFARGFMTGR